MPQDPVIRASVVLLVAAAPAIAAARSCSVGPGGAGSVRIRGEIEAGQHVPPGVYADAPTIILSFEP